MTIVIHLEDLSEDAAFAVPVREALHSDPEIGLHLPKTEARILAALKALKIDDVHTNIGGGAVSGIVAILRGTKPGRTIALRADTDALPIEEKTGKDYASRTPGRMHACGHDGHTAALLTVLSYLSRHRDFAGTLIAVFQPGEEGFAGSRYMIKDGLVEKFGIEEFYALHGDASVDLGKVAFFPGYAMANADAFEIVFEGKGGHGSKPQLTHDPVVAASEAVLALQTIVSRNVNPDDVAVVSVCSIEAGTREGTSVIPQSATLRGTVRTYEKDVQDLIELRMHEIANGIAVMFGMNPTVTYNRLYPALYNDPERTAEARSLAETALGKENVIDFHRIPGGEDFAFMLQKRPGCIFRLGIRDRDHQSPVHTDTFDFNDEAIETGAAVLLTVALNRMAENN